MLTTDPEVLVAPERIEAIATQLAHTATGSLFLEQLAGVHKVAPSEKMDAARAAVDRIKQEVAFPRGFRLTTRQFESPDEAPPPSVEIRDGVLTIVYEGGVIVVTETSHAPQPREGDAGHVRAVIKEGVEEIGRFVAQTPFKALLGELYELPADQRAGFVEEVVLDPRARAGRGLDETPPGLVLQRSEFADGRPTLFCVSKVLPLAYPWHKVTITFDNDDDPAAIADM
ncbi:MAG TPA: hypothetical protein VF526_17665 [Solirubrobacteraceae bacterium]|jgi:hypothetical protein